MAEWIISQFCPHESYIEVFGGAACVLLAKPRSYIEVYNDLDGDIVHFFETLQAQGDALADWLEAQPYSRELHGRYSTAFYDGHRPADDVERAGRFIYLRQTSFVANEMKSFSIRPSGKDKTRSLTTWPEKLRAFRERLRGVIIEQLDYAAVFDKYDQPDALFYCDPPYVGKGDSLYSHEGAFDHARFVDELTALEGQWVVSYEELPPGLSDYHILEYEKRNVMRSTQPDSAGKGDAQMSTERLVLNFDPAEHPRMSGVGQPSLGEFEASQP